jgi:PAS domain-containing protein
MRHRLKQRSQQVVHAIGEMFTMTKDDPIPVDDQSLSFRQIVDSSPVLLHAARPDGYHDFFNRTWLDFTGEPLEKLLGWGWTSCIHPEDVEAFVRHA